MWCSEYPKLFRPKVNALKILSLRCPTKLNVIIKSIGFSVKITVIIYMLFIFPSLGVCCVCSEHGSAQVKSSQVPYDIYS